ncbi:MAG: prepilin-type N-terminal cleavage/methylation domain-containing protein [Gammaproteobacteria bacterium]|nr:prepilin-type N-terminal cleavage/methylation domain-containing protein [Gammaproteobacteria bacterium]MCH9715936.1 prepilin-type N-terminal cleavage/methylation domain-containing protein [Gammaproteobacteria bacterium]MCH9762768.1 prepilin-type N-terminal cleavage/methylation domain-containing protein [Gammaproteobacteria bacterium]
MVHARKRGFSLTEVLVSLALISGGSLLLLKQQVVLGQLLSDVHIMCAFEGAP